MKIIHTIDHPNLYGSELHMLEIIKYFKEKNDVWVISMKNGPLLKKLEEIGVNYDVVETKWWQIPFNYFKVRKIIKRFQPDIVHAHQPKALLMFTLIGWFTRIPTVITLHSKPINNALLYSGIQKYIILTFHTIISFLSQLMAKKVRFMNQEMMGKAYFKNKSVLISNWVDPKISSQSNGIIQDGVKGGKIKFLTIGSISSAKGYDLLIDFFGKLKNKCDFESIILGEGDREYIENLNKKAKDLEIEDRINYVGYRSNRIDFLKNADFFVLFSHSETFGRVYVEAMAFGLPIIGKNLDIFKETAPQGNIISDDIEDCVNSVVELIKDQEKYKKLSRRNQEWVREKFDYNDKMRQLEDLYLEILDIKSNE